MIDYFYRAIFKILRILEQKWCLTTLDYSKSNIKMIAKNWREWSVRAQSCKKEPETVSWLESNCRSGTLLLDIGANVGAYTLVAASLGSKVVSFEPGFANFNRLNENVSLNGFDNLVKTFPIAFSRTKKVGQFQFLDFTAGSSACFYNESGQFISKLSQVQMSKAVLVYTLDSFMKEFEIEFPDCIKIDVDGAELEILQGGTETLSNSKLKSVIVEVDHRIVKFEDLNSLFLKFGFRQSEKHPRGNEGVFNYVYQKG